VRRAGHPPPLLVQPEVRWLEEVPVAPPLGIVAGHLPTPTEVALPPGWELLLMTDGIYEGRAAHGRLGTDDLAGLAADLDPSAPRLLDRLIDRVTALNGGPLADDVALLALREQR
jgi:serine phosphatase RsbU (regulator of sigma subunit)